ncbi:MAG: DUF1320 domain-containing protein [Prevotellaceae bacterium]|jgi:hypothetical protein|nr:DUF1320 domain-containing protein [Prevotellaceae bacterium]
MFLTIEEMKSVLYEYQMNEIAEGDDDIIDDGIAAAVSEVRAYFEASNQRRNMTSLPPQQYQKWKEYDVDAIFNATGNERNPFVMRLCKRVAAYNICELSNVDVIYDHIKERYDNAITTLEKIAGMGEYANAQLFISGLPSPVPDDENTPDTSRPFRAGSRTKFNHE